MSQCRIVITQKCNLKCPYCCMQHKEVLDTFEEIHEIYNIKNLEDYDTIMITGGEPLHDLWSLEWHTDQLLKVVPRNAKIYLYTNGTLLQPCHLPELKRRFNGLNIGLHEPDSWDYRLVLSQVNKELPVRILIYEKLVDDEFIDWCKVNNIEYRAWKMDECDADEDRYIIKR